MLNDPYDATCFTVQWRPVSFVVEGGSAVEDNDGGHSRPAVPVPRWLQIRRPRIAVKAEETGPIRNGVKTGNVSTGGPDS